MKVRDPHEVDAAKPSSLLGCALIWLLGCLLFVPLWAVLNFAFGTALDGPIGVFIMETPCQRLVGTTEPLSRYSLGKGRRASSSVCHFASGSIRVADRPTEGLGFTGREFVYLAVGFAGYAACLAAALMLAGLVVRSGLRAFGLASSGAGRAAPSTAANRPPEVAMRSFEYVGPAEIKARSAHDAPGVPIVSKGSVVAWLRSTRSNGTYDDGWATYVVDLAGRLLVAPRRTEHVACAFGNRVLAAGEIRFSSDGAVTEVTNNSTGFCPAEDCWPAVQSALQAAALDSPPAFTFVARFRRCTKCGERNLVKDDWFQCAMCDADLPSEWNFG